MIRKLILATAILFMAVAIAQTQDVTVRYQGQLIGSRGLPLANQSIAVCTQPTVTSTQPCSPLATLGTSTSTSSGGANPLTTDVNGNFFFYAAPGKYTVQAFGPQVSGQFVQPDTIVFCSPTGTCTSSGTQTFSSPIIAAGTGPVLTGTGSCATFAQQVGGSWAGSFQCTAATAASTVTITFGVAAPHGWTCSAYDMSTRANLLQQTTFSQSACILTATSVTQNDFFTWSAVGF
jgi:hypothetical protein